jgi:hypothetical protein
MTTEEKYQWLIEHLGVMKFHPLQDNYYAAFALFGDGIPAEIWDDAEKWFRQSLFYRSLSEIQGGGKGARA